MTQFTVLVADDDRDIREDIGIYLKNEGYRVLKEADLRRSNYWRNFEVHVLIPMSRCRIRMVSRRHSGFGKSATSR